MRKNVLLQGIQPPGTGNSCGSRDQHGLVDSAQCEVDLCLVHTSYSCGNNHLDEGVCGIGRQGAATS